MDGNDKCWAIFWVCVATIIIVLATKTSAPATLLLIVVPCIVFAPGPRYD